MALCGGRCHVGGLGIGAHLFQDTSFITHFSRKESWPQSSQPTEVRPTPHALKPKNQLKNARGVVLSKMKTSGASFLLSWLFSK